MSSPALYPGPTVEDLTRIPAELTARPQWVLWRGADRLDTNTGAIIGLNKIPYTTDPDQKADTTDPQTWASFQRCVDALPVVLEQWEAEDASAYRGGGVGFVFASDDPFAGIDFDHCVDPDTGALAPWAKAHVDSLASYTEVTPSRTGLHTLVHGVLPPRHRKKGPVEMYTYARFFTMTGWHVASTPPTIASRHEALYEVHGRVFGPQALTHPDGTVTCYCPACDYLATLMPSGLCPSCSTAPLPPPVITTGGTPGSASLLDDTTLLAKARAAKNGARFAALWEGTWQPSGYPSQSEADLGLCTRLVFWTQGNAAQIDRLFRQSGLMRKKWDAKHGDQTYGEGTIAEALARQTTYWTPSRSAQLLVQGAVHQAQQGHNGHTSGMQGPSAAEAADTLLDDITAAVDADRLKMIYAAIDTLLVSLSTAEWAVWVDRAKALLGKRLDLNRLQKAYNEALARQRSAAAQRMRQGDPRPDIEVLSDLAPPVDALQAALLASPRIPLYQRGRFLVHTGIGGPKLKWLQRPPDMPQILLTAPAHLRELASRAAQFWVMKPGGKALHLSTPPLHIIETLMARPSWTFPPLEGIVNIPTLCPDGTLLTQQGYHPDSGLFLDFNGVTFPPLPSCLDLDAARSAIGKLQEVFIDFPYDKSAVHFSATLAALLSCVCRYAILGHVPLFAVRSTTRGSGKGKLIDAISLIALGRSAPRAAQTLDEEEERKRLLSLALAGVPLLHLDNVNHPLGSGPLDLALTSPTFGDRMLGKNEQRETPLTTVFFASGNQMQFRGDMARRVIPIDLDPKQENPEQRDNFQHPDLETWVAENRPRLVMDALTIMQAYFAVGAPTQKLPAFGSYEAWSVLIRQALMWAGEADPCDARLNVEAESDPKYEARDRLLHMWEMLYKATATTLNQVVQDISFYATTRPKPPNDWDHLRDALGAFDPRYDGQKINTQVVGEGIRAMQGLVINKRRFVKDGTYNRAAKWKIERFSQ